MRWRRIRGIHQWTILKHRFFRDGMVFGGQVSLLTWPLRLTHKAIAVPLVSPRLWLVVNTLTVVANVVGLMLVVLVSRPVIDRRPVRRPEWSLFVR